MTDIAEIEPHGAISAPATLTIRRLLPGPIERVWDYLTRSDLRRQWLADGEMELRAGAAFEFVWRNDELGGRPGSRPAGFPAEQRMGSRIVAVDPPRMLTFAWAGSGDVTFELEPQAGKVLLTVTHRSLPDRDTLLKVAAGWHMHLDILAARAAGGEGLPFWEGWKRLRDDYDRRLPA